MPVERSARPGRGSGGAQAIGCWGGCWPGGCWGGCWPGLKADPEILEAVAKSLGGVEGAPPEMSEFFKGAAEAARKASN